jgi:nucleoside-diphosphate-sugar epimerase
MQTAQDVVTTDLAYICGNLKTEFTRMAGQKLLIVGGAGFLGYYLVQSVLHWNQTESIAPIQLTVYDNYRRGVPIWLRELEENPHLTLSEYDITRSLPADVDDFQYIIHAASIASPTYYRQYPIETMDVNVNGLRTLLEYAKRQKHADKPVAGFLFFSTSEIYGDPTPDNIPTPETYWGHVSCTGPRACYDESKRFGETLCVNFTQQYDLPIKIARPFNNYGPGLSVTDRRVLADFARDVLAGRDIVMLSDGSPTRTFSMLPMPSLAITRF